MTMCGFTGILSSGGAPADPAAAERMARPMTHRGPDDAGVFASGPCALAFRRLSIIDLETGHQPMRSPDGRHTIVFNGEVYNHAELRRELEEKHAVAFRTRADTEVVLHALITWGPDALPRFNGMFAFALWDDHEGTLLLARDRVGKKPLHIARAGGDWLFASEIKCLLEHPDVPRRMDPARLPAFLAYRYVPGDETLFEGITCVRPGHTLTLAPGREPVSRRWWDLDIAARPPRASVGGLQERLHALLVDAVRLRMIADVPFGAFLSGGIDSSMIVALMSCLHTQPIETFSVGFDTGFSEADHARRVAAQFATNHHEVTVGAADMIRAIPSALFHRETPVTEPSDIPILLLSRAAREHVTVVLSGEGSDEILAGYPKYGFEAGPGRWLRLLPPALLRAAADRLPFGQKRARLALRCAAERDAAERHAMWFGGFDRAERAALLAGTAPAGDDAHRHAHGLMEARRWASPMDEMLYLDTMQWLPANLLLRGDRMTMAASLELRCPFLDYRLVEFAAREVPAGMKVRGGSGKWLLKRLAADFLPREIIHRPKWGFKVPVGEWFRGPLAGLLRSMLLAPGSAVAGHLDAAVVRRLVEEHQAGRLDHEKQLWILLQLELWHRMFIGRTLAPDAPLESGAS